VVAVAPVAVARGVAGWEAVVVLVAAAEAALGTRLAAASRARGGYIYVAKKHKCLRMKSETTARTLAVGTPFDQ
jgi:hypothetical protein